MAIEKTLFVRASILSVFCRLCLYLYLHLFLPFSSTFIQTEFHLLPLLYLHFFLLLISLNIYLCTLQQASPSLFIVSLLSLYVMFMFSVVPMQSKAKSK